MKAMIVAFLIGLNESQFMKFNILSAALLGALIGNFCYQEILPGEMLGSLIAALASAVLVFWLLVLRLRE